MAVPALGFQIPRRKRAQGKRLDAAWRKPGQHLPGYRQLNTTIDKQLSTPCTTGEHHLICLVGIAWGPYGHALTARLPISYRFMTANLGAGLHRLRGKGSDHFFGQ